MQLQLGWKVLKYVRSYAIDYDCDIIIEFYVKI